MGCLVGRGRRGGARDDPRGAASPRTTWRTSVSQVRDHITAETPTSSGRWPATWRPPSSSPPRSSTRRLTQAAEDRARAAVPPVLVTVQPGELIVTDGQPITIEQFEKPSTRSGLTRPAVERRDRARQRAGRPHPAVTARRATCGGSSPGIWHRNRSVLLFFLALIVTAVAMRIAADRTLWAFVVPTSATVLLVTSCSRAARAPRWPAPLAVLAGVMNRDALELAVLRPGRRRGFAR